MHKDTVTKGYCRLKMLCMRIVCFKKSSGKNKVKPGLKGDIVIGAQESLRPGMLLY